MIGTQKAVGRALVMLETKSKSALTVQLSCALQSPAQPAVQVTRTRGPETGEDKEVAAQVQGRYAMGAI